MNKYNAGDEVILSRTGEYDGLTFVVMRQLPAGAEFDYEVRMLFGFDRLMVTEDELRVKDAKRPLYGQTEALND